MKVGPAPPAATISTAATARGIRQRSRKPAAGDSMVPTMKAIVIGRKNAFGEIEAGDDADDQQRDERKGHDFRAADDRRQLGLAVGDRRAFRDRWRLALTGRRFCRRRFAAA